MAGYFSFQKLITPTIVKAVYVLGFVFLTASGLSLIVWAGMRLHDANIARQLGWRYVAIGAAAVVVGNLAWRVICEFWMVLFNLNAHLESMVPMTSFGRVQQVVPQNQFVERRPSSSERRVVVSNRVESAPTIEDSLEERETFKAHRAASVLGLS